MASPSSTAGEWNICGFTFLSNFDSGNLGHVQLVHSDGLTEDLVTRPATSQPRPTTSGGPPPARPGTSSALPRSAGVEAPDVAFNMWTRPDCCGTEFENGNRTWFYFGLRGGPSGAVVKFTMMNLNKQSKLFSQGMSPVFMLTPGKHQWERLRDKPTYQTEENSFNMSFRFRTLEDTSNVVYFAFTYPYTYKELQANLAKLYKKHGNGSSPFDQLAVLPETSIYYHQETVIRSLEHRKLSLLTITGMNGIQESKEDDLENLFAEEENNRPYKFLNKKTIFLSARVHPGETCSSFVINGFIKFLLRESDPRAVVLRRKYVFKLIPMLNPDGVYNGHYRTDTRGVNLNRVYTAPSRTLHPTIYAARKLILYAHCKYEVKEESPPEDIVEDKPEVPLDVQATESYDSFGGASSVADPEPEYWYKPLSLWDLPGRGRVSTSSRVSNSSRTSNSSSLLNYSSHIPGVSPVKQDLNVNWYEMTETSRFSEGDESIADFSYPPSDGIGGLLTREQHQDLQQFEEPATFSFAQPDNASSCNSSRRASSTTGEDNSSRRASSIAGEDNSSRRTSSTMARTSFAGAFRGVSSREPVPLFSSERVRTVSGSVEELPSPVLKESVSEPDLTSKIDIPLPTYFPKEGESGLFLYVDIHGHASKRGIFMYGNHFDDMDEKVDTLLFPKLMSVNSANFDFPACNFTQKNMIMKDRHTGAGREGSGRVGVFKMTGLSYCYTLECNFNTGRHVNAMPATSRDCGRSSPSPFYDSPPKYTPAIYEETGKAMAISILDITESNPWTRLTCSDCKNLKGVKSWIQQYIKSSENRGKKNGGKHQSPMRTRFRNLAGTSVKKSPSLKLPLKSPASPENSRSLSKVPRKSLSPKFAQSASAKTPLQRSQSRNKNNIKNGDQQKTGKKKRVGSANKKKTGSRPSSKTGSRVGSKPGSRSGSRSSSPHRTKLEPKATKIGLQKKVLKKVAVWKGMEENQPGTSSTGTTGKKLKKRKPKVAAKVVT